MEPSKEKLEKLPVWAREYIRDLEIKAEHSKMALDSYLDDQSPSKFFTEEMICDTQPPRFIRRNIKTHSLWVEYEGVKLNILIRGTPREGIELSWGANKTLTEEVPLIPLSYQKIKLIRKENVR